MEHSFSADEIFEMAKQIEVNGAAFYRKAAQMVPGKKETEFLEFLANMEDQHEKIFEAMHADLKKAADETVMFDPDGEAVLYLKAIADSKIFFQKAEPGPGMQEILSSAVKAEQDSITFYLGLKKLVPGDKDKARVEEIIQEEMSHLRLLTEKMAGAV